MINKVIAEHTRIKLTYYYLIVTLLTFSECNWFKIIISFVVENFEDKSYQTTRVALSRIRSINQDYSNIHQLNYKAYAFLIIVIK